MPSNNFGYMPEGHVELNDHEVAVLIDSLAAMRDLLRNQGFDTPNVESALAKVNSLMTPSTYGLRIEAVQS